MGIYWKIDKTSNTGKEIKKVLEEFKAINKRIKTLCDEFGTETYNTGYQTAGIVAMKFDKEPDMSMFKYYDKAKRLYAPKKSTKAGKSLLKRFEACGSLPRDVIDKIVGNEEFLYTCGFEEKQECYVISTRDKWHDNPKFKLTEDCKEIKWSDYKELKELDG